MRLSSLKISILAVLAACASSSQGTRPHDMSTSEHERAAREEERAATLHAGAYDPAAQSVRTRCRTDVPRPPLCWTSIENPTAEHQRDAEAHRRLAVKHRAASAALVQAEARACAGIAEEDRDLSPFDRVEDIASVEPLTILSTGRARIAKSVGAVVTFRARPGMTAEWLQRVVDCHLARNAALGHVMPEMPNCPLVPKDITARVTSTGNGFAVEIRSEDPAVASEVLDRARRSAGQAAAAAVR